MWVGPPLCDFEPWTHSWPWPWIFKVKFKKKKLYLRNGRVDWHETKGMRVKRMLNPLCDHEFWYWSWTFKVKLWNRRISRMGEPIDMEWKGCLSIGCWTHYVTLTFNLTLDLGFLRINFHRHISGFRNGRVNKIWWQCLVPTSTTRFTIDVGYRLAKNEYGYRRK